MAVAVNFILQWNFNIFTYCNTTSDHQYRVLVLHSYSQGSQIQHPMLTQWSSIIPYNRNVPGAILDNLFLLQGPGMHFLLWFYSPCKALQVPAIEKVVTTINCPPLFPSFSYTIFIEKSQIPPTHLSYTEWTQIPYPRFNIKCLYYYIEIYIILVNTESFLQCHYLCMVQCVYDLKYK